MARKNRTPEENARREKIRELLQMANIGSMDDIQNLFKETIAEFMENGLEAELDDELGYSIVTKPRSHARLEPMPTEIFASALMLAISSLMPHVPIDPVSTCGSGSQ